MLEESVASYQELQHTPGLAEALLNLGLVRAYQQNFAAARTLMEQSISLCRAEDDTWLLAHALDSLARLAWEQGDAEATRRLSAESMRLGRESGETRAEISPRKLLAAVALAQVDDARDVELCLVTDQPHVGHADRMPIERHADRHGVSQAVVDRP